MKTTMKNRWRMMAGLLTCVLLSSNVAQADIITFSVNQTHSQGGGSSDIASTAVGLGGAGSFTLDPGLSGDYFDFQLPGSGTFSTLSTPASDGFDTYYFLKSYAFDETVGAGNFGSHISRTPQDTDVILLDNVTGGSWGSSHSGYLGFRTSANVYGWINYNFTRSGSISTLTMNSGAYNDVAGEDILAGSVVPEPATAGMLAISGLVFYAIRRIKNFNRG